MNAKKERSYPAYRMMAHTPSGWSVVIFHDDSFFPDGLYNTSLIIHINHTVYYLDSTCIKRAGSGNIIVKLLNVNPVPPLYAALSRAVNKTKLKDNKPALPCEWPLTPGLDQRHIVHGHPPSAVVGMRRFGYRKAGKWPLRYCSVA